MANENVKIIVQEVNQTAPKGSGSSSDIAYVPGFSSKLDAVKNTPILCTTVSEFEDAFGATPYVFTEEDVVSHSEYLPGDIDKSYVYAKELINAGIAVLYENIQNLTTLKGEDLVGETTLSIATGDNNASKVVVNGAGKFSVTGKAATAIAKLKGTIDFTGVTASQVTIVYENCSILPSSLKSAKDNSKTFTSLTIDNPDGKYTFDVDITADKFTATDLTSTIAVYGVVGTIDPADPPSVFNDPIGYFYTATKGLSASLEVLKDKNEYQVKYITSGAYPTFRITGTTPSVDTTLAVAMKDVASTRNDAVALIDHTYNRARKHNDLYSLVAEANITDGTFATMFTPYGRYSCPTMSVEAVLPASFGYLMCVAKAIKTSPNWLAMAGVARGMVPNLSNLECDELLSNVIAENFQPKYGSTGKTVSINCITNIKPYGLCIWGNRTLEPVAPNGTTALNFLNTRNMISDVKKVAYSTAKALMFEQDSDTLWLRFKSGVSPLLDQLVSGAGISNYKIIKGTTKFNGKQLTRGEMAAVIRIFPVYAVEYFEITVVIADEDVAVQ